MSGGSAMFSRDFRCVPGSRRSIHNVRFPKKSRQLQVQVTVPASARVLQFASDRILRRIRRSTSQEETTQRAPQPSSKRPIFGQPQFKKAPLLTKIFAGGTPKSSPTSRGSAELGRHIPHCFCRSTGSVRDCNAWSLFGPRTSLLPKVSVRGFYESDESVIRRPLLKS